MIWTKVELMEKVQSKASSHIEAEEVM